MTDRILYENGIELSDKEHQMLTKNSISKNKQMAAILKNRIGTGLTYQEMIDTLQSNGKKVNIDSVRRGLTQMTGSKDAPEKWRDKYGRWPLVKLPEKRLNPDTGIKISVYAWNERYGQPMTHREIVAKQQDRGQMNFHVDLFEDVK